jgi:hypothetical protein
MRRPSSLGRKRSPPTHYGTEYASVELAQSFVAEPVEVVATTSPYCSLPGQCHTFNFGVVVMADAAPNSADWLAHALLTRCVDHSSADASTECYTR